ncbi:MAG TPA: hypothetical protein VK071_12160 [Tissierellales bacterium]|nr:hypothetical protein [Tissierellales bacterium]
MKEEEIEYDEIKDIEENKTLAGLAYLLFFLPLVLASESKYGRFHANQGLILLIFAVAGELILKLIPGISLFILPIFDLFVFILVVMGMVNGFNGKTVELPLIGRFNIIK